MADSFAVKMYNNISVAINRGKVSVDYRSEASLERKTPGSHNKRWMANTIWLVESLNRNQTSLVREILDWTVWARTQPFMMNEALTPEDIYRGGPSYSYDVCACVAREINYPQAVGACDDLGKSNMAYLLAGLAPGNAKMVVDRGAGKPGSIVLKGTGKRRQMAYIVQPGMRGWVREGKKGDGPFQFTEHDTCSGIVCMALNLRYPKGLLSAEHAIWTARLKRWKRDIYPAWGLSGLDLASVHAYRQDLANPVKFRPIVKWMIPTNQDFEFYRYVTTEIEGLMSGPQRSSTDPLTLDGYHADGTTYKTSPEDGVRSTNRPIRSWREQGAMCSQFEDHSEPVRRIPRVQAEVAFSVIAHSGREAYVDSMYDGDEDLDPTPINDTPTPHINEPEKDRGWL